MNWDAVGSIGEVVGAAGVVISLLIVAYQLRSNTHALRSSSYQSLHDGEDRFYSDLAREPELAALWKRGVEEFEGLSGEEAARWEVLALRMIFMVQHVHYQRRKGMVDDEIWEPWRKVWADIYCTNSSVRAVYEGNRDTLTHPFLEMSDAFEGAHDPSSRKAAFAAPISGGKTAPNKAIEADT